MRDVMTVPYGVVLDRAGRELGFIDPDPILPTGTPDLE